MFWVIAKVLSSHVLAGSVFVKYNCSSGDYGMAITAQMVTAFLMVAILNKSPNFGSGTRFATELFCQWGQSDQLQVFYVTIIASVRGAVCPRTGATFSSLYYLPQFWLLYHCVAALYFQCHRCQIYVFSSTNIILMLSAGEPYGNYKVRLAKFICAFPLKNLVVPIVLPLCLASSISYWTSIALSLGGILGQLIPSLVHFLLHQLAFLVCHAESISCYSAQVFSAGGLQHSKVIPVRRWVVLYNSSIFSMEWYVTMYLLCSLALIFCSGKALKGQGVAVKCEPIRPVQFYQCGYRYLLLWVIGAIWFLFELLKVLGIYLAPSFSVDDLVSSVCNFSNDVQARRWIANSSILSSVTNVDVRQEIHYGRLYKLKGRVQDGKFHLFGIWGCIPRPYFRILSMIVAFGDLLSLGGTMAVTLGTISNNISAICEQDWHYGLGEFDRAVITNIIISFGFSPLAAMFKYRTAPRMCILCIDPICNSPCYTWLLAGYLQGRMRFVLENQNAPVFWPRSLAVASLHPLLLPLHANWLRRLLVLAECCHYIPLAIVHTVRVLFTVWQGLDQGQLQRGFSTNPLSIPYGGPKVFQVFSFSAPWNFLLCCQSFGLQLWYLPLLPTSSYVLVCQKAKYYRVLWGYSELIHALQPHFFSMLMGLFVLWGLPYSLGLWDCYAVLWDY